MFQSKQELACASLWRLGETGQVADELPPDLRPATREAGYAIQACVEDYSSEPRAGWKIAATSAAGQRHINVDGPIAGRLLSERIHASGTRLSIANNRMRVCEPEFGFRFGEDVPARARPYSVSEVMAKVADLHLTLELPDSRFADFTRVGTPSLIADNACAWILVVGERVSTNWRDVDLVSHRITARVRGRYDREGQGANVLGDPQAALTWLVNEVSALGIDVRRGEIVTTGTCMAPLEIEPGDLVDADFGRLGSVTVSIDRMTANQPA